MPSPTSGKARTGKTRTLSGTPRTGTLGSSVLAGTPVDTGRLQESLQHRIDGALGQLSQASQLLSGVEHGENISQLDQLLEEVVRLQDDIAARHDDLAELTGGPISDTVRLGISQGITKQATVRFDGQDHNRELFYERTIQTLEQQLLAFRRGLDDVNKFEAHLHTISSDSEDVSESEDLEAAQDELAVDAYVHKCRLPTREELAAEVSSHVDYERRINYDILGCFFFFVFIIVAVIYAYVRIRFSIAPLGNLVWYGALVFAVEMIGAMAIVFYGVWLIAVPDNSDIVANAAAKELRRAYHIRVLVPCYSEPLAIVQRTVLAARRATVPAGCRVTIYLCDDGKRADKRKFVDSLKNSAGPDVVYITGRKRGAGKTLNGKSENLNHTLKLIYPDDREADELPNIPIDEVMCLFDADQSCSKNFFTALMPYIDSGDDVAVALSPQLMFNVQPDMDIFNHQNVHFWEKMQPGMDALGFISLTGTNMILRCRALQDCGWFPVDSVTEDWELGMRMKKWGWKCRYVQQYNAIGEAPDVVRQCFQQRSRWCKGHFQTFWSKQCPLIDRRLGLFFQLCYSSTCLSYISAALAVPVMCLVPIITLCFGYFPIALNFWTVVAITIYYISLHALTFYSKSMREFRALWLANIATTILFWPYSKAALFTPLKQFMGKGLSFKATSKGAAGSGASLREIGPSLLLLVLLAVAFIAGVQDFDVNVNAPKAIALCWILYNAVPHLLLIIYARFGSGRILQIACTVLIVLQTLISMLALVLLWVLYPREEDYVRAADLSLNFLQAQRSGVIVQPYPVAWRFTSGMQNVEQVPFVGAAPGGAAAVQTAVVDLSAGFYNDGEVGPVKVTAHVALTVAMLAWSLLDYHEWWAKDPVRHTKALDIVSHGLDYVNACYVPNPLASDLDPGSDVMVYLVGDIFKERMMWRRPEDVREKQPVWYLLAEDSPADLAAQITAGIVSGTLALYKNQQLGPLEATANVDKAHRLFRSSLLAPSVYTASANVTSTPLAAHYPSNSYLDDLFWASTWMLRASQREFGAFREYNSTYYYTATRMIMDLAFAERDNMEVSAEYLNNVALVHAASITKDWQFHSAAQSWIWDWICSGDVRYTTFGRAHHPESMMLGDTALAAAIAAVYVHAARKWGLAAANQDFMSGFHCFAEGQGRLFLGTNYRKPLLAGFNARSYEHLWHRGAACPSFPAPCDISVAFANMPDKNPLDGALLWLPGRRDECPDVRGTPDFRTGRAENGTVVSLENNIGVPLLFAALSHTAESRSYMECLQGQGSLMPHPVCRHDRPLATRLGPADVPKATRRERFRGIWTAQDSTLLPPPPPPVAADYIAGDLGLSPGGASDTLGASGTA